MKWDEKDASDERVVKTGRWCSVNSVNKIFPNAHGVYIFADQNLNVKFIGCSKENGLKQTAQESLYRDENYGATKAFWLVTADSEEAQYLRRQLVKKYLFQKKRKREF
jgi:hypothetical protein